MWQAETWDPKTIDRELSWAHALGFTSMRVFLHDIVWKQDREGFLKRMDEFLDIADNARGNSDGRKWTRDELYDR